MTDDKLDARYDDLPRSDADIDADELDKHRWEDDGGAIGSFFHAAFTLYQDLEGGWLTIYEDRPSRRLA